MSTRSILLFLSALVWSGCSSKGAGAPDAGPSCKIDLHGGPSAQTTARVGAIYFDGWSGGLNDYHISQLRSGADGTNREPLSGWEDATACEVEQQLAWARSYGVSFFLFDWYYPPSLPSCEAACWYLNNALTNYRTLSDHHGVGYAILYIDQSTFTVPPASWSDAVSRWAPLFLDADYARVGGKPLFMIVDLYNMRHAFGDSHAAVKAALDQLRAAAVQEGLPGLYIVGGFGVVTGGAGQDSMFYDLASYESEGYDAYSMYSYGQAPAPSTGPQPFSILDDTAQWIWAETLTHTSLPSIPVATIGFDARPENFQEPPATFPAMWFDPAPSDAAGLVRASVDWAAAHPRASPEPAPAPPLVLIDAWNELLEGSYLVPTVARQHTIGDAIAADLARGTTKPISVLTLQATTTTPYLARGTLLDGAGHAISGRVAGTVKALDGAGLAAQYTTSGTVPVNAAKAYVVAEANTDSLGPGPAQVTLTSASFLQGGDSASRVPNGDFSSGATGWSFVGPASYVSNGGHAALALNATSGVMAWAGSTMFGVTPGATFTATFAGTVAPLSTGNGAWLVAFFDANTSFISEYRIVFVPADVPAGTVSTSVDGSYSLDISSFGSGSLEIEALFDGGGTYWPAYRRVKR